MDLFLEEKAKLHCRLRNVLKTMLQGTLKSLLQHRSSKASILRLSAFFIVQLSQPYMATGKTIALTRRTFFGKVTSLLFNMLSRLEKEMAAHSSVLAWRIPGTGEPAISYAIRQNRLAHTIASYVYIAFNLSFRVGLFLPYLSSTYLMFGPRQTVDKFKSK